MTYATDGNVNTILGNLAGRLPATLAPLATFRDLAHATLTDALTEVYPNGIPEFAGVGLEALTWAEAKLAAAEILGAVRVNLPDLGDAPERLRREAMATVAGGVVGYPPGSSSDPANPGGVVTTPGPRVSSFTPASAFPDPYDELRGLGISGL